MSAHRAVGVETRSVDERLRIDGSVEEGAPSGARTQASYHHSATPVEGKVSERALSERLLRIL